MQSAPRPLITRAVDESQLTTLKGNTHHLARREFDLGTAPATLPMQRMLLVLKRSPEQQLALRKLLDDQQDKHSPNYHKWVTPEEFGQKFGPNDADMQTITGWLQAHGFEVGTTKGRTVLEFSGSASQVREAFHTTIHKYIVKGEQHWANASDPEIPAALVPAIAGVATLHNFYKKPTLQWNKESVPATLVPGAKPQITLTSNGKVIHALSPQDYRVIYNMNDVLVPGTSNIAVIGRSNLYNGGQDVSDFWSIFGGGIFSITVNGADPGDLGGGEEAEATLDSTWSMGLAPWAMTTLVVSASTDTTDGVDLSELYIVDQNLAAIMTESFSACELYATDAQLAGASALAEQAAAQGITYVVSTGDDGAAGCDDPGVAPATHPNSVNYLASTAFNVAVGGTMFNEGGQDAKYWASTTTISASALSYIPEEVWNESSLAHGLWAGSGGASTGNIASGAGTTAGVRKPNWQSGLSSIPSDGVRDIPDISLTAGSHDPYLLCLEGSCRPDAQGRFYVYFIGGTSAAAPAFAAIMAYVNDQNARITGNPRLGLPNYVLYRLAASQAMYPAQCNGSNGATALNTDCIFHDVTTGSNVVPGETGLNYPAGAGYDLATGLGSVNVANLANQWNSVTFNPTTTAISVGTPTPLAHGSPLAFTVTVTPSSPSTMVPSGDVFLYAQAVTYGYAAPLTVGPFALLAGTYGGASDSLPGGSYFLSAGYSGDANFASSSTMSSVPITIIAEPSTITLRILSADQTGNMIPFTSGPFGSMVYLRADVAGQSTKGTAMGMVTFSDSFGPIPGPNSSFALNSEGNTATPHGVFNFDTGTHSISATYGGDSSFVGSSTTQPSSFTITPGFFAAITPQPSTVVISQPGGSGQLQLLVANSTAFSGTIKLACAGLPPEASCRFAPAIITATGTANTNTVMVTVSTTAASALLNIRPRSYLRLEWILGFALLPSLVWLRPSQRRGRVLMLVIGVGLLVVGPSCGGGGGSGGGATHNPPPDAGTPIGSSNVIVSATSGSSVSTSGFTLIIR
jgi:Pro-kumamolisin, activation domain/Bacterial Ig-like domain (group 3)